MTAASHRGSELDRSRKKKLIPMYLSLIHI